MFNRENFEEFPEIEKLVKKINKYLEKEKKDKLQSKINDLKELLDQEDLQVPITYILSVLIEEYPNILSPSDIGTIEGFMESKNLKLKLNSIILVGFYILEHPKFLVQKYYNKFTELLSTSREEDIRDNCYFFLERMMKENPAPICACLDNLIETLEIEIKQENIKNIISLLNFLRNCKNYNFNQLYTLRDFLITTVNSLFDRNNVVASRTLQSRIVLFSKEIFPDISLQNTAEKTPSKKVLRTALEDTFIMKRYDFSKLKKKRNIKFMELLEEFKASTLQEHEIYFYTKNNKKKQIYFYELEREKLLDFFEQDTKISREKILETFLEVLEPSDVELFMKTLIKLGHIRGYLSNLYFYPKNYINSLLVDDLNEIGIISLKDYNYLPINYVINCVKDIGSLEDRELLIGNNKHYFYDLSNIKQKVSKRASRDSSIDLKEYRQNLTSSSFLKLVKSLPNDYLTKYHKGTSWLTNIGKTKFNRELENSKIIGFFDVDKISSKIELNKGLLRELFNTYVDERTGIWNKSKKIFYYSKYIKSKLEKIDQLKDAQIKEKKMTELASHLNIEELKLQRELDEKINSIAEEMKHKDKIKISKYMKKTGMEKEQFFQFINSLGISYLKKGDLLLFSPSKIENAKKKVKHFIKKESDEKDFISLGTYDVNSALMKELIEELQESHTIDGIFYEEDNELRFYTERGIKKMMLSETFIFSLYDFFYDKELSHNEINLLKEIFYDLYETGKLNGEFDEETLTFSNEEIVFANDYNATFHEFNRCVSEYIDKFNSEFTKIKKILGKTSSISAKEIKWIEDTIHKINKRDIYWKNELEAFINRVNKELLKKQGVSMKYLKSPPYLEDKKEDDIRIFAEDEEVKDLMEGFNLWVKLFNRLEQKYENVLFYQKRLKKKPDDEKTKRKLEDLKRELNLIDEN
jgi:hypothetical protein